MKHKNICIIGIPEETEKEQEIENLFQKIMAENIPNLESEKATQVQEAQRIPIKNTKRPTARQIIIKMPSVKTDRLLKAAKGETESNIQGSSDKASS